MHTGKILQFPEEHGRKFDSEIAAAIEIPFSKIRIPRPICQRREKKPGVQRLGSPMEKRLRECTAGSGRIRSWTPGSDGRLASSCATPRTFPFRTSTANTCGHVLPNRAASIMFARERMVDKLHLEAGIAMTGHQQIGCRGRIDPDAARCLASRTRGPSAAAQLCTSRSGTAALTAAAMADAVPTTQVASAVLRSKISMQNIAKMAGASREMVSRAVKDMQLNGRIEIDEGLIVLHEGDSR